MGWTCALAARPTDPAKPIPPTPQPKNPDIVDLKPPNMDDLNEVITSAAFHPSQCNIMMYSSSRGIVRVADLRQSALCTAYAQSES
jgi:hypothetical protein